MKILLFLICFFVLSQNINAQTQQFRLWGSTGTNASTGSQIPGYGSIFTVNSDGSDFLTVKQFAPNPDGSIPFGALTKLSNGDLVGTTQEGGTNDFGVVYKLNSDGSGYSKIFEFDATTGFAPKGKLLQASNGDIYGTTSSSKSGNEGIIFRLEADGSNFANLHHFRQAEGIFPVGGLIEGSDGNLYGMTSGGGAGQWGTIYKIALDGTGFQKLIDFDGAIDYNPWGELVEGTDGYLYGSTNGHGIFKVNKTGSDFQRIYILDQNSQGIGSLVRLSNGDLIGAASGGAYDRSFLFSIKPDGTNFTVLYDLNVLIKGNITVSPSGHIYGVADDNNTGVVFRIETNGTGFTTLYSIGGFDNGVEQRNVIETSPGLLIGVASKGGASNSGVVFKLTTAGLFTKLKDFPQEGADPESEMIKASNGDLYGTTTNGGAYGWGTIFKIKADGTGYTKVFDFDGINGRTPVGRLLELPGGFLYGTTKKGGIFFQGNLFKIKLDGTGFVSLKDFDVIFNNPTGDLLLSADGFLYGTTASQNSNSSEKGVIYKMHPDGSDFSVVVNFAPLAGTIGTNPIGIRQLTTGDLLGVTTGGGSNFSGTIFKVKTDGTNAFKLRDLDFSFFNVVSKNIPIEASDGKLYGTNFFNSYLYSINTDGTGYTEYPKAFLYESYGNLLELSDGALYGTSIGGSMFKFVLNTASFNKLINGPLDPTFANSFSYSGLLAVEKQNQTISFNPIVAPKTFGDPDFLLTATASSGLPVSFTSSNLSVATITGNTVTIVGAGTTIISAFQTGDIMHASAGSQQTLVVNKADQTITFNSLGPKVYGDGSFTLSATTNSGLPITYSSSDETVVRVIGNIATVMAAGTATITAKQIGSDNYLAASVLQNLLVNKANQLITFNALPTKKFGDPSFQITGTTDTGLPVEYTSSSTTIAHVEGNKIYIHAAGQVTISCTQSGNSNYNAAQASQVLTIDGLDVNYNLWGTTWGGGNGKGTIIKMNSTGSAIEAVKKFEGVSGFLPQSGFIKATDGNYYGMVLYGGIYSKGTIIRVTSDLKMERIHDFNGSTGSTPFGNLMQANDGAIYGMTYYGGAYNGGVIFKLDISSLVVSVLHEFNASTGTGGFFPLGGLIQASNGLLYGMTMEGGTGGSGTIFKMDLNGSGFVKIFDFDNANGRVPRGTLIENASGDLFGLTNQGGANASGVLFKIKLDGSGFNKIIDFSANTNGSYPGTSLIQDQNGALYGVTQQGGANGLGAIFKVSQNGTGFERLIDFDGQDKGSGPLGTLVLSQAGELFGMTSKGGVNDLGVIFRLNTDGSAFQKLADFSGFETGSSPAFGPLLEVSSDKFIGMTASGGVSDQGAVFSVTRTGQLQKVGEFSTGGINQPSSSLVSGSSNVFFGSAYSGGKYGKGGLYKIDPIDLTFTKLIDFDGPNRGAFMWGSLTEGPDSFLYGMTSQGGANDAGVVFRLSQDATVFEKLHDFSQSSGFPRGDLLVLENGDLFGMTTDGSAGGGGEIFKMDKQGTYTTLFEFTSTSGRNPRKGRLIRSNSGQLFGVTEQGGAFGYGTVFRINQNGAQFQKLHDFNSTEGGYPCGSLLLTPSNELFGLTRSGGVNGFGIIFKIDPDGSRFTKLFDFNATSGGVPEGGLIQSTEGFLFGITSQGGQTDDGTVFRLQADGLNFQKLYDLSYNQTGSMPGASLIFEKRDQNISFGPLTEKIFGDAPFSLTARSDAGIPVSFKSNNSAIATVDQNEITITGAGQAMISAFNDGDQIFRKLQVDQILNVRKKSQTISFGAIGQKKVDDLPFELSGTTSSGLQLSYSTTNTEVAIIKGNIVTIIGAGTTDIIAKQPGNENYEAADDVSQSITVNKASQTITFNSLATKTFGDAAFTLLATATSGLAISYTSSDETVATVSGNTLTLVGAGTTNITAVQTGNSNFNSATEVTQKLTINKADQTITFPAISVKTFGDAPFSLTGTSTSGLPVLYSTTADKVSLSGSQVTINKPGSVTLDADQSGNGNYNSAAKVSQTFCINPSKPVITTTGLNSGAPVLTSSSSAGNQWYKNGVLIADATSTTLSPTDGGSYSVKVTIDNCASETSTAQVLVITGDNESLVNSEFFIYPNPTTNTLTINLTGFDASLDVDISIYNESGKTIERAIKKGDRAIFSVSSFPTGGYFIKASQFNRTYVAKFVKE